MERWLGWNVDGHLDEQVDKRMDRAIDGWMMEMWMDACKHGKAYKQTMEKWMVGGMTGMDGIFERMEESINDRNGWIDGRIDWMDRTVDGQIYDGWINKWTDE